MAPWTTTSSWTSFQTGSGTSTNTNANEVIANRATELLGGDRGSRLAHPNDHVNICQSSNDVIPTAIHLAALIGIKEELVPAAEALRDALRAKAEEFWPVIKTGRTHLQDATPIRLGQELWGYAGQMERALCRVEYAVNELAEVALGGTAVGTGVNAHPEFAGRACALVSELAGVAVRETDNHFQAQSTLDGVVAASGALRTVAVSLHKIANDIRWLGSGPRAGLAELALPEVQPGSSIMPGKVNPVIAESAIQAVAQVLCNDAAVVAAGQGRLLRAQYHDARGGAQPPSVHLSAGRLVSQPGSPVRSGTCGHGPRAGDGGARAHAGHGPVAGYWI